MNIRLRNINKSFNNKGIIKDLSINFSAGSFNVIQGENGSGKTTILDMIAGIINQDSGHIYFDRKVVDNDPPFKRKLFYIPQNLHKYWALKDPQYFCFIPDKSVEDNLIKAKGHKTIGNNLLDILDRFDLYDVKDHMPNNLSFGLQQRLALARAFLSRPYLIMFDEPLSSLDEKSKEKMIQLIKDVHINNRVTILYVTHDIKEAEQYNALHYNLEDGRLMLDLQDKTVSKPAVIREPVEKSNINAVNLIRHNPIDDSSDIITAVKYDSPLHRCYKCLQKITFTLAFLLVFILAKLFNFFNLAARPFYMLKRMYIVRLKDRVKKADFVSADNYEKIMYYFDRDIKKIEEMSKNKAYEEAVRYAEELKEELSGTELEGRVSLYIYKLKREHEGYRSDIL